HRVEDLRPPELRVQLQDRWVTGIDGQEVTLERKSGPEILSQSEHHPLDLCDDDVRRITLVDPAGAPNEVDERVKRDGLADGQGAPLHPGRALANAPPELPEEP